MKPWIDGNEEIKYVFDTAFAKLHVDFGLSLEDAEALVRRYLALFTDEEFCRATRAPLHDADFFTHEGGLNLAIRMFWCLRVNPNSQDNGHAAFIKWRTPYQKRKSRRAYRPCHARISMKYVAAMMPPRIICVGAPSR